MQNQAHLYLVDGNGEAFTAQLQEAVRVAFTWVVRMNPDFDQAKLANWAEEVAASMSSRAGSITNPKRYAMAALEGKLRDWRRLGLASEVSAGSSGDLELLSKGSRSFESDTHRTILFDQLRKTMNERDQLILLWLRDDRSISEIASALNTNYNAAAKAIQRLKDRMAVVLNGSRAKAAVRPVEVQFCGTKG